MAATMYLYDSFMKKVMDGSIDLDTDTFKIMIASNSYTPSQANHDFRDDVTNEVSGTNYTAGGATLSSVTLTLSANLLKFDAADVTWSAVTFTNGRYGVIYKSRGGAASADELVGYVDFGANYSPSGSDFTIQWNASGIFTASRTP